MLFWKLLSAAIVVLYFHRDTVAPKSITTVSEISSRVFEQKPRLEIILWSVIDKLLNYLVNWNAFKPHKAR